ncbi:hypothetical protein [Burkholderia ubonensis]|uniref:hypothetical protein n=1 Tax=Burkholderia ubonensis TaxID=101571 RepID=UPI001160C069|nr:hypothetical protein [Burkholderia ubonensis]
MAVAQTIALLRTRTNGRLEQVIVRGGRRRRQAARSGVGTRHAGAVVRRRSKPGHDRSGDPERGPGGGVRDGRPPYAFPDAVRFCRAYDRNSINEPSGE